MSKDPAAVESLGPFEGPPGRAPSFSEWTAWDIRKLLPSELVHKVALRWPGDVGELIGMPDATLKKLRAEGDHPRLYGIGRALFTTRNDLHEWLAEHELQPGQLVRPATVQRGTKRRMEVAA